MIGADNEQVDRRTGREMESLPQCWRSGDAGMVRMIPTKPFCVEPFVDYPPLGRFDIITMISDLTRCTDCKDRFAVRDLKQTVAVGVVKKVVKKDPLSKKPTKAP